MNPENQPKPEQTLEEMFGPEKAAQMRRDAEIRDEADKRKLKDY